MDWGRVRLKPELSRLEWRGEKKTSRGWSASIRHSEFTQAFVPPSTVNVVPVIWRAAGLARKATAAPMSAGVP